MVSPAAVPWVAGTLWPRPVQLELALQAALQAVQQGSPFVSVAQAQRQRAVAPESLERLPSWQL